MNDEKSLGERWLHPHIRSQPWASLVGLGHIPVAASEKEGFLEGAGRRLNASRGTATRASHPNACIQSPSIQKNYTSALNTQQRTRSEFSSTPENSASGNYII